MNPEIGGVLSGTIIEWLERARSSDGMPIYINTDWRTSGRDWSSTYEVDHNLALFIRSLAARAGDTQLRALAESLLIEIESISPAQMEEIKRNSEPEVQEGDGVSVMRKQNAQLYDIRELCRKYFIEDKKYAPDFSKYMAALSDARSRGVSSYQITSVEKYLAPEAWIKKIHEETERNLTHRVLLRQESLDWHPTAEDIANAITPAIERAEKNADNTVGRRLGIIFAQDGSFAPDSSD